MEKTLSGKSNIVKGFEVLWRIFIIATLEDRNRIRVWNQGEDSHFRANIETLIQLGH